jgi:hypothetical protein
MRQGLWKKTAGSIGMAALLTGTAWGLTPSAYADHGGHGGHGGRGCDDGCCFDRCSFGPNDDFGGRRFRHHDDFSGPFFGHR